MPAISPHPHFGQVEVDAPEPDDERYWSVTTILGVRAKPALEYWAAEQTAEAAVDLVASLPQRLEEEGREAVVKYLAGARYRRRPGVMSPSELGTAVHAVLEEYALTGVRPAEVDPAVVPFVDQFEAWADRWQPEYLASEATVYSPTYRYAGTLDAVVRIEGRVYLLDYKTTAKAVDSRGKPTGPYPEAALQLVAYRRAELMATWRARRIEQMRRRYYLLGPAEAPEAVAMMPVDGSLILHLTPSHANLHPARTDDAVWDGFLACVALHVFGAQVESSLIGAPL